MPRGKVSSRADRNVVESGRVLRSSRRVMKPCSSCVKSRRDCRMSLSSGCCTECLSRGSRCELFVPDSKWDAHEKSRDKLLDQRNEVRRKIDSLRAQEDQAFDLLRQEEIQLLERRRAAQEQFLLERRQIQATEERLDVQIRFLERREKDYVSRDLASIEEMKRLEIAEAEANGLPRPESPVVEEAPPLDPLTADWFLLDPYKIHPLNPASWLQPALAAPFDFAAVDQTSEGSAGGTVPVSSGNSAGTWGAPMSPLLVSSSST